MNRVPTLDGWRGIAVILVLIAHGQMALLGHLIAPWMTTGEHGVTIFFVLSGFLITSKLLEGPIHLGHFYTRRFFRLMPAAWVYLVAVWLVAELNRIPFGHLGIGPSLLFYRNFAAPAFPTLTSHFWSLSVEEQFYLFWPCLLLLSGVRRARWISAALAVACATYRWFHWDHYGDVLLMRQTQVRADALLIGCLLALLLPEAKVRAWFERWSRYWMIPAMLVLAVCAVRFNPLVPLTECVAIALAIAATMLNPHALISRALSFRPIAALGVVSYSVYLWQNLFMCTANVWAVCLGIPLFSYLSYRLIEKPCTAFGHRITHEMKPVFGSASAALTVIAKEDAPTTENVSVA